MLKRFKLLSLAAFVIAAALSSCQKQEMESFSNEAVSSDGTRASSFSPRFGIDWDSVTAARPGSSLSAISSFRATADKDYLYMLVKVDASQLSTGSSHAYDNFMSVYLYDSGSSSTNWKEKGKRIDNLCGWLITDQRPEFTYWGSKVKYQCVKVGSTIYNEIRFPRSLDPLLQKSSIKLGVTLSDRYYRYDESYSSRNNLIGCIPSKGKNMYALSTSGSSSNSNTTSNSGSENNSSSGNHCADIGNTPMVMIYVPSYSSLPSKSEVEKLTHINYFGYKTDANGNLSNAYDDVTISDVLKLKKSKSSLKVLLTVGGASKSGTKAFSSMANSKTARKKFCDQCKKLVTAKYSIDGKEYTLDGVDLDWEHPDGSTDRKNFNQLLQDLRETLGNKKIISAAVASTPMHYSFSGSNGAMAYLDYVNVMSYDMSSSGPYHHSALYPSSLTKTDGSGYYHSCSAAVKAYRDAGVPLNKQNLGVAFYGHGTYMDSQSYKEIHDNNICKYSSWDDKAKAPYYKSGSDFLGYDDDKSANLKGQYVKLNELLGVMGWSYGKDYQSRLLKSMYYGVNGKDNYGEPSSKTKSDLPL